MRFNPNAWPKKRREIRDRQADTKDLTSSSKIIRVLSSNLTDAPLLFGQLSVISYKAVFDFHFVTANNLLQILLCLLEGDS